MATGSIRSTLLAVLTIMTVFDIRIQATDVNNSEANFTSSKLIDFELNTLQKRETPYMASRLEYLTVSSMKNVSRNMSGYGEDMKAESSRHGLRDPIETFNDSKNATRIIMHRLDRLKRVSGHRLHSLNRTFGPSLDSSIEPFDHRLDDSLTKHVFDELNSTCLMLLLENSAAKSRRRRSDNSKETENYGVVGSTGMIEGETDKSTQSIISGQSCTVTDSSNNAAHLVLIHMYGQLSTASERINELLDKCAGVNIQEAMSSDSCEQRCGYIIAATDDNLHPCHCDQSCWLYGDCCSDYYPSCLHLNIMSNSNKILLALLDNLPTYSQVLQLREVYLWSRVSSCTALKSEPGYIQMVNKCSDDPEIVKQFEDLHSVLTNPLSGSAKVFMGLSKLEIKQRCEHVITKNQMIDYITVTLVHHKTIHFYNVFCAICNGVNLSLVTAWPTHVACDNGTLSFFKADLLSNDRIYEAIMADNCTAINAESPTCHFRSCIPQKSRNDRNVSDIQSSCRTWNSTTWVLCQRYQNYYLEQNTETFYKNLHCLACHLHAQAQELNGKEESTLSMQNGVMVLISECERDLYVCKNTSNNQCVILRSRPLKPIAIPQPPSSGRGDNEKDSIPSFRILLDFRPRPVTFTVNKIVTATENKTCPQDQVYEPLYQSCRQVLCLPGTRWLKDRCVDVYSDTEKSQNESCLITEQSNFNNRFLLYPNGSKSVRINIGLDCVLEDSFSTDNVMDCDTCSSEDENDSESTSSSSSSSNSLFDTESMEQSSEFISAMKTFENNTKPKNKKTCSVSECSMSSLFELSNIKSLWIQQIKKKLNLTQSKQSVHHNMTKIVTRKIRNTVVYHLGNTSQLDQFIVCSNATCFTYSFSLAEIYKGQPTVHPYNSCFARFGGSSKFNKTKYESFKGPDICLSFVVRVDSSEHFDNLIKVTKTMVSDIARSAHQTNFILSTVEITNMINITNDDQTQVVETRNGNMASNVRFTTSNSDLCQDKEVLVSTEIQIERYSFVTHRVNFSGTKIELAKFVFTLDTYRNREIMKDMENQATIGWCQVDLNSLKCESSQISMYEPPHFVIYNGILVLTLMADNLTQFIRENETRREITDLIASFAAQYGDNSLQIVGNESYIRIRSGVLVCSNLTNTYLNETHILLKETKVKFMPDSEIEIVATLIASVLSIFCLACTLAVYSVVSSLRNVSGKIVMSFSATLLCAQVLFLCCTKPKGLACEVYASVHHAAWLASYSWLGAMSVHLARILNSQCNLHIPVSGNNTFQNLTIICWGIPCLLAGLCLALHKTKLITIGYGDHDVCWIGNFKSLLLFVGVPVFLILAVTLVCAVAVLRAVRKSIVFRSKSNVVQGKPHKQLILCVNLSLLMGFGWLFYFLAVGMDNTNVWAVHTLVNGSQGLYVFLCFAARQSLLSSLVTKMKLGTNRARQVTVSSDVTSLKMSPTTATSLGSPCPSVKSFTISKHYRTEESLTL